MQQSTGFEIAGNEDRCYKLNTALYGLKQIPRAWYNRIDCYFRQLGFSRSEHEATMYLKEDGDEHKLNMSLYVNDMFVIDNNGTNIEDFKKEVQNVFEMSDLGKMTYFLGLEVNQIEAGIFISQKKYALDVLRKFKLENCKNVATPLVLNEKISREMESFWKTPLFLEV